MFYAAIETKTGEVLNVVHPNGRIGGKAILSFIMGLSTYCDETDVELDISQWFRNLEENLDEPICQMTEILTQSFYSGEWDYNENEYEWFLYRTQDTTVTEEKFRETIQQLNEKWVDASQLLTCVSKLLKGFQETVIETTWWYESDATDRDFEALQQVLTLAVKRRAKQVRLRFT